MINPENSDHGKADALVRCILCLVFGGRGRPPCHQLINPTLLQLPPLKIRFFTLFGTAVSLLFNLKPKAYGRLGINSQAKIYSSIPLPPKSISTIQAKRTATGSILKYSPNPPQMPAMTRFSFERNRRFTGGVCSFI